MRKIQTLLDLQELRRQEYIPKHCVEEIKQQFIIWERELNEDVLDEYGLPPEACMYHFDHIEDGKVLQHYEHQIEYVDTEQVEDTAFFRIGLMQDHQMTLIFVLEEYVTEDIKYWLYELGD